jgi:hypothetical protein
LVLNAGKDGVKTGVLEPFNVTGVAGLGDLCGGGGGGSSSSSTLATFSWLALLWLFRVLGCADWDNSWSSMVSWEVLVGVIGWLVLRDRGMLGRSIEGTDETLL